MDLIRATKASRGGICFVPSSLRLREVRLEKVGLSASPDAFCAASGLKQADPRLHSGTPHPFLTLAISQCVRINPREITETYHDPHQLPSMDSDSDRSEFNSHHIGLTSDGASSLVPPTFYKSHHLLTRDEVHRSLAPHKSHLIPVEILSEIFLYTAQAGPRSQANLMLVCRRWHDIMLSTPGIHSELTIFEWTKKKDVERFGKRWLLDVFVHAGYHHPEKLNPRYWPTKPAEFHGCFMAAAKAASRWRSLALLSLPPLGEYKDLQIMHPLQHLESFKLTATCDLGNFLEPLLNTIITTVTLRFTVMEVFHTDAALYLLQPAHFQTFSCLTTLKLRCKRRSMQNTINVLPCLHKLEIFEAHHLFLPYYPPGVDLPLIKTLRVLHLKSVSVQWMTGQIFPALGECSIIFPHHAVAIQAVYMPSCSILRYDSNNLGALEHFHISHLDKLEIKCGQWNAWRGALQVAVLHRIFAVQSLTCLHLEIKCNERLLVYMLRLVPALEELWMRLSSPHSLSSAFFLALAAGGRNANSGPSDGTVAPLCKKLRMIHLHYKRWSRSPERNALIPAFGAVVASHHLGEQSFSFRFIVGEGTKLQEWNVHEPVESFDFSWEYDRTTIGVSSPDGIVPLSRSDVEYVNFNGLTESEYLPLPRESEYIGTIDARGLPIDFLFSFHSLKEVKMTSVRLEMKSGTHFLQDAPLFHTLKVLDVHSISSSFFAGQTFHKLERYEENLIKSWFYDEPIPEQPENGPWTEMPVCTKLTVQLSTLATLKLPQIRELCVNNIDAVDYIWEKHISVNANLSGLKLLHVAQLRVLPSITFMKILGLFPALESLIIRVHSYWASFVECLEAFVPMNVLGPSGPNQSIREGQISGVPCPRLESLQIGGINLAWHAKLMPVLKAIVTRRAAIGSPLKSFTFCGDEPGPRKWQLIGWDDSFWMQEVCPYDYESCPC